MSELWDQIQRDAAAEGFPAETMEKVVLLVRLLDGLFRHPYLRPRLALKGGTAINLFVLDLPRLSVDVDLNYIGAVDRPSMLAERPLVERAIEAVCGRLDLRVKRVPTDHAGGKWRLGYGRAAGGTGVLELDLNFVLRAPLWPVATRDSRAVSGTHARDVAMLDIHELIGGKLAALFGRCASRDVFDATALLGLSDLDSERLRQAFVVYGGINRRDWRTLCIEDINLSHEDVQRMLLPMLRLDVVPTKERGMAWTDELVDRARLAIGAVLPLRDTERDFLDRLNDRGDIVPELITKDAALQSRLRTHPGLLWKAQNVKEYRG